MTKSLKILQIFKKIFGLLSSITLFVGAILHIVLTYSGGAYKTALFIISAFSIAVFIFMCLNFAYLIVKRNYEKNNNITPDLKTFNNNFINKTYAFANKYSNVIGIILSAMVALLCILPIANMFTKSVTQYWKVYFNLIPMMWGLFVYLLFSLICSKDKKSLVNAIVFASLLLILNVVLTVLASIMMFGKVGQFNNTLLYNILLIVYAVLSFIPMALISTNGCMSDYKFNTCFGLGTFTCIVGSIVFNSDTIVKRVLYKYGATGSMDDKMLFILPTIIVFVVLSVLIVINAFNIAYNLKKFIKQKEFFGLADILLGILGLVLFMIGVYRYTIILLLF